VKIGAIQVKPKIVADFTARFSDKSVGGFGLVTIIAPLP
jgi:hypothetical protein